jgi:phosphatidylethanolamine/phosphatidyl-N-methylethanolamine N-methyltransferase
LTKKTAPTAWPKPPADLTEEQRRIQDDWMYHYHECRPDAQRRIVRFNHAYAARSARPGRTVDIGAGLGEHLRHEDLTTQEFHAVDVRPEMVAAIERDFPSAIALVADCQQQLPFEDASFDRAIAIHVLEHLRALPAALAEIERILKPGGVLSVVIPCEGGLLYGLGRRLTTQRAFERRYGTGYRWHIESDHVNQADEVIHELRQRFQVTDRTFYPSRVPIIDLNVLIGLTCVRRPAG